MADAPPPDAPRAGLLISLAWNSTIEAGRTMPALFGSAALLSVMIKLADIGADYGADHLAGLTGRAGAAIAVAFWGLLSLVLDAWVLAPVAVAVHRMVLLEETTPGIISWRHPRIWRFAGWTLLMEIVLAVAALPIIASRETRLEMLVLIAFAALMAVIGTRWLMIFPAVAVEVPASSLKERIRTSWDQTRGHFWRLILALIGSAAFLIVPLVLIEMIFGFLTLWGENFQALFAFRFGFDLVGAALQPIFIALGAAVASWFYMWQLDSKPPAVEA